jgi:hypothetical protein
MKVDHPVDEDAPYAAYLAGAIDASWTRCLPVWTDRGRVNDLPRGIRFTRYLPSFETLLGRHFVERFADESWFLLDRFQHGSKLERDCAFDLLDFLAQHLDETSRPLPDQLRTCDLPLPSHIRGEVAADWIYRDHGLDTIGKLLCFEHNGQRLPDD